jgi:molybdopterin converting factor small subunit
MPDMPSENASKVRIRFFGPIREAAKSSGDELDFLPDTSVYGLMQKLSGIYGEDVHAELLDEKSPNGLRDDLMITLNESIIDHALAADTKIDPGCIVALFQTFPGGG